MDWKLFELNWMLSMFAVSLPGVSVTVNAAIPSRNPPCVEPSMSRLDRSRLAIVMLLASTIPVNARVIRRFWMVTALAPSTSVIPSLFPASMSVKGPEPSSVTSLPIVTDS